MGRSHAQGVWTVSYGSCELSPDGMCVSDGNGVDYSDNERCTVRAEVDIVVSA